MKVLFEKEVRTDKIVVSPRPIWKCRACKNYYSKPSCPPYTPDWKETRDWIKCFKKALLIKFQVEMENYKQEKREVLKYLLNKQKELFSKGYEFAHALFPGECNLCEDCLHDEKGNCINPEQKRPSISSVGIELSSLVNIDFSESVLYGLIIVE